MTVLLYAVVGAATYVLFMRRLQKRQRAARALSWAQRVESQAKAPTPYNPDAEQPLFPVSHSSVKHKKGWTYTQTVVDSQERILQRLVKPVLVQVGVLPSGGLQYGTAAWDPVGEWEWVNRTEWVAEHSV